MEKKNNTKEVLTGKHEHLTKQSLYLEINTSKPVGKLAGVKMHNSNTLGRRSRIVLVMASNGQFKRLEILHLPGSEIVGQTKLQGVVENIYTKGQEF